MTTPAAFLAMSDADLWEQLRDHGLSAEEATRHVELRRQQQEAQPSEPTTDFSGFGGGIKAAALKAGQGATLNLSDEAAGTLTGLMPSYGAVEAARALGGDPIEAGNTAFHKAADPVIDDARTAIREAGQQRPWLSAGSELVGGGMLAAAVPATSKLASSTIGNILLGAGLGGGYGFGGAEGTPSERAGPAQEGALIGGAAGLVLPPLIRGAWKGAKWLGRDVAKMLPQRAAATEAEVPEGLRSLLTTSEAGQLRQHLAGQRAARVAGGPSPVELALESQPSPVTSRGLPGYPAKTQATLWDMVGGGPSPSPVALALEQGGAKRPWVKPTLADRPNLRGVAEDAVPAVAAEADDVASISARLQARAAAAGRAPDALAESQLGDVAARTAPEPIMNPVTGRPLTVDDVDAVLQRERRLRAEVAARKQRGATKAQLAWRAEQLKKGRPDLGGEAGAVGGRMTTAKVGGVTYEIPERWIQGRMRNGATAEEAVRDWVEQEALSKGTAPGRSLPGRKQ